MFACHFPLSKPNSCSLERPAGGSVTGPAVSPAPGAAQGSVLRSRREGGPETGEGTGFPRKLLCPADTERRTRVFWAVQADAAAPGQPWAWGAPGGQDTPVGARGKSAKGIFFPLPLPLPRQQTSGSFLRN